MFVLTERGEVIVFRIKEELEGNPESVFVTEGPATVNGTLELDPIKIKDLKDIKQISCGLDHFCALNGKGQLFAMGDDTFG